MTQELVLRDYQQESINRLSDGWRNRFVRQLLVASTGAGKSLVATEMIRRALEKGTRVGFVVDRVTLIDQFSAMLDSYGIDHGVIQADHWRWRPYMPVQVCSAQTLERRTLEVPFDLLIVDEAHAVRSHVNKMIMEGESKTVGLTATPFTKGLGKIYQNVVNVTTANNLIADGFLSPIKIYSSISPDMTGAKIVAGEWSDKEIEQRGTAIIGDIVQEWQNKTTEHFGGPVKTIVFSASIAHGEEICRQFQAAGHNFVQITAHDDQDRRRAIIEDYRQADTDIVGIVSCEVLSRGFDVPDVLCGIGARPYRKSLSAHIQQIGRVMRIAPGKTHAIWLDHAGNCIRMWEDQQHLFEHGVSDLDNAELDSKVRAEPDDEEEKVRKCLACGFVLPPGAAHCPSCGKTIERRNMVETTSGSLVEIGGKPAEKLPDYLLNRRHVWRQLASIALEAANGDAQRAQKRAQAQYKELYGEFFMGRVDKTALADPTPEVRSKVARMQRRFLKIQAATRHAGRTVKAAQRQIAGVR